MDNRPIGVFDSGIGGLTVLEEIHKLMPNENIIYFGDSGRAPYGTKSRETVQKYTFQDINFLRKYNVKMIVIACNTASACSIEAVRKSFVDIPVVEVVEPGSHYASTVTKNKKIGLIATAATVNSGVYERTLKKYLPDCEIVSKACPLFVPLVEEGWWQGEITEKIIEKYLSGVKSAGIDTLILGCTHYPYLEKAISEYMGKETVIVNSARVVAGKTKEVLETNHMAGEENAKGEIKYFTSDSVTKFTSLGKMLLNSELTTVEHADIESVPADCNI